jgi:hypothetical protein
MGVKSVPLGSLGLNALLQLQCQQVDVSKQLRGLGRADLITFMEGPKPSVSDNSVPFNKYHVSAKDMRTADGVVFDSKLELQAYVMLRDHRVAFEIHPRFELQAKFVDAAGKKFRAIVYEADFWIRDTKGGDYIIDMKGVKTREFITKEKLFTAKYHKPIYCMKSIGELLTWLLEKQIWKR